jgi:hypothetical protein
MNSLPYELFGLIRQYAGVRPQVQQAFGCVLKQMRRKRTFKRIRKALERSYTRTNRWWVRQPNGQVLWMEPIYIYLDEDERRRFAQISHERLIQQVIGGDM